MDPTLKLSARAAGRIKAILSGEPEKQALRLAVLGGGCSGFQYDFSLAATREAGDLVIEREGAILLVDPASLPYVLGSTVDFTDDLMGAQFVVDNPNAAASCGCGVSFAV